MFERYTETARRVIFFARYEASRFGSREIEALYLLLAILREAPGLLRELLGGDSERLARLKTEAENWPAPSRAKIATSVDLPLSHQARRILAYAAEEAERLGHKHIGPEHILLGILRETGETTDILVAQGITLEATREYARAHPSSPSPPPIPNIAWPHDPARMALMALAQDVPEARITAAMRLLQGLGGELFEVSGEDTYGAFRFTFGPPADRKSG